MKIAIFCSRRVTPRRWSSSIDSLFVIAPGGRDAAVVVAQMASAGWRCISVEPSVLVAAIRTSSLGAAILTTNALEAIDHDELRAALSEQARWSDCPLILLSSRGYVPLTSRRSIEGFGNVTVLERPLHPSTLITAVATALRSRARQRRTQAYLQEREDAQANVRSLAATLEARVIARTIELTDALAERQIAEDRLRQSEERYRLTIELSSQTPWIASADFEILSFGKSLPDAMPAAPARDFRGAQWHDFIHLDDLGAARLAWESAKQAKSPLDCYFRMRVKSGEYAWHRARANPKLDEDGAIYRWYGTIENIDQQRRGEAHLLQLQSELIHVSRVSAMGTMASTLAHVLNQPLTAVANYLRGSQRLLARLEGPGTAAIATALGEADRSVMRAGEIVRRLREMVMLKKVNRLVEDAASVIREACNLALIDVASLGIAVHFDLGRAAVPILVDRVQIQQVLINLLRNAVEAVQAVRRRKIWIQMRIDGGMCEMRVIDSGGGVADDVADKLFTPFNSTKVDGMGIGLSISRTIVEAHGGQISGGNSASDGAEFTILLPIAPMPIKSARQIHR